MKLNGIKIQLVNNIALEVISGGNIFNKAIVDGLKAYDISIDYNTKPTENGYDITIIDSLCMHEINLKKLALKSQIIALIHQLPKLGNNTLRDYKDHAKFIVTGEPTMLELISQWEIDKCNIEVLRPAIPKCWKPKKVFSDKPMRVVIVANYIQNKGFEMLIPVLSRLKHSELEFHIIGNNELDVNYANNIVDAVQNTNNNVSFYFNLNRDEVYKQLIKSDIFLSLSKDETFGMAIYEALSINIPCIAYKTGDYNFFKQYPNYIMIDNYSENEFVESIQELVLNYEEYSSNVPSQNTRVWSDVIKEFMVYLEKIFIAC